MDKRKAIVIAVVLFLLIGLGTFVFANPSEERLDGNDTGITDNGNNNEVDGENTDGEEETEQPEEEVPVTQSQSLVYAMPLEGEVVNPFSGGELVKNITLKEWRTHDGADLAAAEGTPVKAIADGTVVELEEDPLWGVCVAVSHSDGAVSYYMGISANVEVSVDDTVTLGQTIGYVGNTAQIEIGQESHLHLGLRSGEEWVDPISYIQTRS